MLRILSQGALRFLLGLAVLVGAVAPAPTRADERSAIKAALVYNILRFVTFPGNPSRLRLCGVASDPTSNDLRRLDGRPVGGGRIEVTIVNSVSNIGTNCDAVYLETDSPRTTGGPVRGQIMIGAAKGFAESGGTVGLINFGGQVRFVINAGAARRANVAISSQLMQLAAKVVS